MTKKKEGRQAGVRTNKQGSKKQKITVAFFRDQGEPTITGLEPATLNSLKSDVWPLDQLAQLSVTHRLSTLFSKRLVGKAGWTKTIKILESRVRFLLSFVLCDICSQPWYVQHAALSGLQLKLGTSRGHL